MKWFLIDEEIHASVCVDLSIGRITDKKAPPGLLISLGDGSAVECPAEMLASAHYPGAMSKGLPEYRTYLINYMQKTLDRLIQQAQEKR